MKMNGRVVNGMHGALRHLFAVVFASAAGGVCAADIHWQDDPDARGTEDSPVDMYDAAKWSPANLPSSSQVPFFTSGGMTYVTNTCPDAASTAIGGNAAVNGDFTFLGDYRYAGSLLMPYGATVRDSVVVKKGDWSLNNFEPGHQPNVHLLFRNVSGDLTVRGLQDISVALRTGASVTIEKDAGDWTVPYGFYLGNAARTRTTFRHRGGNMDVAAAADKWFILGAGLDSTNELYMTGGTLVAHSWILVGGNASTTAGRNYFEISGAKVAQMQRNGVFIGYRSGGHNELCVKDGGVFDAVYVTVGQDNSGAGVLTVDGGEANVSGDVTIAKTSAASSVNLKGGRLTAARVLAGGKGNASLAFDGGTLRANRAGTLIVENAKLSVTVGPNGGTIDCGGFDVSIAESLDSAPGAEGGMTFAGTGGTIRLDGAVNYAGATRLCERTHLVLKDAAMKSAILARGLTVVSPGDASPRGTYTLLTCADGTPWTEADIPSIALGDGLAGATLFAEDGAMKISMSKRTQTWTGAAGVSLPWTGANWDGGASWDDGNDAVFATDGALASVDAAVIVDRAEFAGDACVTGPASLVAGTVSVASGKCATISAPTAGPLTKTGEGTLMLDSSRTNRTTLAGGALVIAGEGTRLDWSELLFGTDPAEPLSLAFVRGATASVDGHFDFGENGREISLEKESGDLTVPQGFWMDAGAGGRNIFRNYGGTIDVSDNADNFFVLGRRQASDKTGQDGTNEFYMAGGTLSTHSWFLIGGNASTVQGRNYFEISNATVNQDQRCAVFIGYKSGGHNELRVKSGGVFNARDYITVGQDNNGAGMLSVDGGEVNVPGNVTIANTPASSSVFLYGGRLTAAKVSSPGKGAALLAFDGGTLRANRSGTLIVENAKLSVTVGAKGGTIDANGCGISVAEPILEDPLSAGGGMTFKGYGSISLASGNTYAGTTLVEVGTALSVPEPIDGERLAFAIPEGLEDGFYPVVSVSGSGAFDADVLESAAKPDDAKASFVMSTDGKTIYCIYGSVDNSWVGGTTGSLDDPESWLLRKVPGRGDTAIISGAAPTLLTIPQGVAFSPSAIVFPEGSAAVTIAGEGTISGVSAVTNLSACVQTVECPLTFADVYRVHCGTHPVDFAGGAVATRPASDMTDNAASHTLKGEIMFTADWEQGDLVHPYVVPDGSVLRGEDARGNLSGDNRCFLSIAPGGKAFFKTVLIVRSRSNIDTDGELHVEGLLTVGDSTTNGDNTCLTHDENDSGSIYVGGLYRGCAKRVYVKTDNLYVGAQGIGTDKTGWYFAFGDRARIIRATDDFEIYSPDVTKDWGIMIENTLIVDTCGHTVWWNAAAAGRSGYGNRLVKEGEGTLVFNPQYVTISDPVTVNGGILKVTNAVGFNASDVTVKDGAVLEVVSGSTTGTGAVTLESGATLAATGTGTEIPAIGGALTLEDGARLSFAFSSRTRCSELAVSRATAAGKVLVDVSSPDNVRPNGGTYVLTSGGAFAGTRVELAPGRPDWAESVYKVDGDIVLDVKSAGTFITIR